jgi:pimeloyl-ACP methyl ester carboxylesterase
MMESNLKLIFLHGLEGTSQGVKATLLRSIFPDILTPDFKGSLDERMRDLCVILGEQTRWIMIGSSFGGLMAALFACQRPQQVRKLVLLAPALIWPDFAANPPDPIEVPTTIYHGSRDTLIPIEAVRKLAEQVFHKLDFHEVDDDHSLYQTVHQIDWGREIGYTRDQGNKG